MRFEMDVLARPDDREGPESPVRVYITASTELQARRAALEHAWFNDMLVSRFITITKKVA